MGSVTLLLCCWHGVAGPDDRMSADWPSEAFQDNFTNILK
jgi:hypothetical protein